MPGPSCQPRVRVAGLRLLAVLAAVLPFAPTPSAVAQPPSESAAICGGPCLDMLERIEARRLWEHPGWHRLLHARDRSIGRPISEAMGAAFFLAPNGRRDLEAELRANIVAFFAEDAEAERAQAAALHARNADVEGALAPRATDTPYCRFPARRAWIEEQLDDPALVFPANACPAFDDFREQLRAHGVALVFSSYYLNNPVSAFGHTFLRIVRTDEDMAEDRRALLDYAIDHAAVVDTPNALVYAFRGLTGLFPGTFSIYPYYYKVRQYNDLEYRDLFEYELSLTEPQRERLTAHLWELGHTHFRYFYTSRNCSYRILAALEVALPEVELLAHVRSPVIPGETIKALYRNEGLVRRVHWRPSLRAQFDARAAVLDRPERRLVRRLARDPASTLPEELSPERVARVLDAAIDLSDMDHLEALILGTDPAVAQRRLTLMGRRAATRQTPIPLQLAEPVRERPEHGHAGGRLAAGFATDDTAAHHLLLEHRLVLHDLADLPAGYPDVLSMELFRTRLRYTPHSDRLRVDQFRLADIRSIAPTGAFRVPLAWHAVAGMDRPSDNGCEGCAVADASLAGGLAFGALEKRLLVWGMSRTVLHASRALDGPAGLPMRLGLGPSAGIRVRLHERMAGFAEGEGLWYPGDAAGFAPRGRAVLRQGLSRNVAIGLEGRAEPRRLEAAGMVLVHY